MPPPAFSWGHGLPFVKGLLLALYFMLVVVPVGCAEPMPTPFGPATRLEAIVQDSGQPVDPSALVGFPLFPAMGSPPRPQFETPQNWMGDLGCVFWAVNVDLAFTWLLILLFSRRRFDSTRGYPGEGPAPRRRFDSTKGYPGEGPAPADTLNARDGERHLSFVCFVTRVGAQSSPRLDARETSPDAPPSVSVTVSLQVIVADQSEKGLASPTGSLVVAAKRADVDGVSCVPDAVCALSTDITRSLPGDDRALLNVAVGLPWTFMVNRSDDVVCASFREWLAEGGSNVREYGARVRFADPEVFAKLERWHSGQCPLQGEGIFCPSASAAPRIRAAADELRSSREARPFLGHQVVRDGNSHRNSCLLDCLLHYFESIPDGCNALRESARSRALRVFGVQPEMGAQQALASARERVALEVKAWAQIHVEGGDVTSMPAALCLLHRYLAFPSDTTDDQQFISRVINADASIARADGQLGFLELLASACLLRREIVVVSHDQPLAVGGDANPTLRPATGQRIGVLHAARQKLAFLLYLDSGGDCADGAIPLSVVQRRALEALEAFLGPAYRYMLIPRIRDSVLGYLGGQGPLCAWKWCGPFVKALWPWAVAHV